MGVLRIVDGLPNMPACWRRILQHAATAYLDSLTQDRVFGAVRARAFAAIVQYRRACWVGVKLLPEKSMPAAALLLLALVLSGCSMPPSMKDWASEDVAGPLPVNYRFTIASGLSGIIGNPTNMNLVISNPRRVDSPKGAAWMVCVKIVRSPARLRDYFTVFIQAEKLVWSRNSVGIDQCESEFYSLYDWTNDFNNPIIQ